MNRAARHSMRVGICIGLAGALSVLAMSGGSQTIQPSSGQMISECDGAIRSIAIQYVSGAYFAVPIYRQFLSVLPTDVHVHVLCPDQKSLRELQAELGETFSRLHPIVTGHAMTTWSRDRWIALESSDGPATLVASHGEAGAEIWPQRLGDQQIAGDLARALNDRAVRSGLFFDGGDLLADSQSLFVAPGAIERNLQHTCRDRAELRRILQDHFRRTPILLDDAPPHHAGMFMMAAGDGRIVVGDPSLARSLLEPIVLPGGPDFSAPTQRRFDSAAAAVRSAGYRVTRIACVPSNDGKTYLTYVNGIIDQRGGIRTIYMPTYQGQSLLNAAASAVWRSLGYRVVPIDVTSAFRYFGTLHCLVNVIEKN
jgi:hypothetical protein